MKRGWAGLIELFVVLMFLIGWGVLELVVLRMEQRKARSKSDAGHAEG